LKPGTLYIEDIGSISGIFRINGIECYQLRMRVLAGDGDFFMSTVPVDVDYEKYNRHNLGLGKPKIIQTKAHGISPIHVAKSCLNDPRTLNKILMAVKSGQLQTLCPYMGTEDVWGLARVISQLTGTTIPVIAPPPQLTAATNNKSFFTSLVRIVLGDEAVVKTKVSRHLKEISKALIDLSQNSRKVALKMSSHASAAGNQIFKSADIKKKTPEKIWQSITRFMSKVIWNGEDEICAVEWFDDVSISPSSQLWIPGDGSQPTVEGLFVQKTTGETCIFKGSSPLPEQHPVHDTFKEQSLILGKVLQSLGYTGRCSFDAIVCGKSDLKFIECNGRWGGTSLPMALMKKIFNNCPFYEAEDIQGDIKRKNRNFRELIKSYGENIYDVKTGKGHTILFNTGGFRTMGKYSRIQLLSKGNSQRKNEVLNP
jgi:hypothetical protein